MSLPDAHDPRLFEHLAKVDRDGVVVSMVEVEENAHRIAITITLDDGREALDWTKYTDGEGHRYVYLTDLMPLDVHGMQLLPKSDG